MDNRGTILAVDDNEAVLAAVTMLLKRQGYTVLEAESGASCLAMAAQHHPDLILLDVNLPDISGTEVVRLIKADPALSGIYVVHLSAQAGAAEKRLKGLEMGADGYISQPVENEELILRVRAFLRHKRTMDALRESENRYRTLFESNPAPMWIFEKENLKILAANQSALLHYGHSMEQFLSLSAADLLPEEQLPRLRGSLELSTYFGKWLHRKKSGEQIEVETSEQDIVWEGKPARVVLASDVTERNRVEKERLRQLEHFEKELRSIGRLGQPPAGEAPFPAGDAPLRERLQGEHSAVAQTYEALLLRALESRVYKTNNDVSASLRLLAGELYRLNATARDIIEIHYETLRRVAPAPDLPKAQALIETGRLTLIELLGYVLAAYRQLTGRLAASPATIP